MCFRGERARQDSAVTHVFWAPCTGSTLLAQRDYSAYLFTTFIWHSCPNTCQRLPGRWCIHLPAGFQGCLWLCITHPLQANSPVPDPWTRWDSVVLLPFPTFPPGRHLLISSNTGHTPPLGSFPHLPWEEPFLPPGLLLHPVHVCFSALPCCLLMICS